MRHPATILCLAFSYACSFLHASPVTGGTEPRDSLFAAGTRPQLISGEFSFTEGPAVDAEGNIYFTDQPNDRIWKYDTDGNLSLYLDKTRRSNGMYFDRDGNLIACADEENQLVRIAPDKTITSILDDVNGRRLNGPNDLWIHPDGSIYFTDPLYERPYWEGNITHTEKENVYLLAKGNRKAVVVDGNVEKPNGIVGTPDGKYLYVADIKAGKTYRYEIGRKGRLVNRQLFVAQGSDGMTIDERGNVYLTGKGITVYDPAGNRIAQIDVPANWTSNVCFGGKQRNKLFITASQSVLVMNMLVKGVQ